MNYIIHLTDDCNFNCKYCYEKNKYNHKEIEFEKIVDIVDREIEQKSLKCGLAFFGGEPLLKKELIYKTINYIKTKKSKTKFYYGITTNGYLIDEEFLKAIKKNKILVAYSIDGIKKIQDLNRRTIKNEDTFEIVKANALKVLKVNKNAIAMVAVTKNNINYLDQSVSYLIEIGFKNINLQFDFFYNWTDEDLAKIKDAYKKVADIYCQEILKGKNIRISLFDEKIKTYINEKYNCNEDCKMGINSINVDVNGNYYPCMQFVEDKKFIIGNCENGVNIELRNELIKNSHKESDICRECAIKNRCKHLCGCKNYKTSNDINKVAPITCETEKIFVELSDYIAEKLYSKKSKIFRKKFYENEIEIIKLLVG